ncbi:helix-turn-helix domain-containing protein [Lactococcus lactis]|uniref:helix-turn-helix domain-containing protein n=1 Tax=Lactococcus lactis TaxID=1358 RepID=UPI001C5586C1|nr:helix-turn-helix domain-containing protein [Lactococcus lactis]GFO80102.1 hypothetical protein LL1119B1_21580 [Lactococcus lactis]
MAQENMISQKLRVLLAQRTMKNRDLANETGIAQSTISRITSGKTKVIQFDTIEKICKSLHVEPSELFTPCKPLGGHDK